MDKLFSIISRCVEDEYPNWFIQDECAAHHTDLIYFTLTVKIHKDSRKNYSKNSKLSYCHTWIYIFRNNFAIYCK